MHNDHGRHPSRSIWRLAAPLLLAGASAALAAPGAEMPSAAPGRYQGLQPSLVSPVQDGLATAKPRLRHIYAAAPDVLALVIDAQAIEFSPIVKYTAQTGDRIVESQFVSVGPSQRRVPRVRSVLRNGVQAGTLVGPANDLYLSPAPRLRGEALDTAWADSVASYGVRAGSVTAPSVAPLQVFRKSKPIARDWALSDGGVWKEWSISRHEIFLRMPSRLQSGLTYRIQLKGASPLGAEVLVNFDDKRLRTEAVQVNQHGYQVGQAEKKATMAMWLGTGGNAALSALGEFKLVDEATSQPVFTGAVQPLVAATAGRKTPVYPQTDALGAQLPVSTYSLDFSSFNQPGRYRVCVTNLGCSFPFRIDDQVWTDATLVSARGYLNQRSGIALGAPYTSYQLPRDMHPDDGYKIHEMDAAIFYDPVRFPPNTLNHFARIQASLLESTNQPLAWGGWHDAADYDRSIGPQGHMRAVHAMMDLYESNPAFFGALRLNIPETGNGRSDILDEALWCLELFRRIQRADGGVPANIESIEHPTEPSFKLMQPTGMSPPTPQTNRLYAAAAAQMSLLLKNNNPTLSQTYRTSAERAMAWADANASVPNIYDQAAILPQHEATNLAAAWMLRLTGEAKWQQLFQQSLNQLHPDGNIRLNRNAAYSGPWGVAVYAQAAATQVDAALQARCIAAMTAYADSIASQIAAAPFNANPKPNDWEDRTGDPWMLVVAHRLTGDAKYTLALERMAQLSLGRNLANASFTSGLGTRQSVVFHLNAYYTGQPIPAGLTIFGGMHQSTWGAQLVEPVLGSDIYPAWTNWPWAESIFDLRYYALTEYTVGGVMANQLLIRGYLAQQYAR